MAVLLIVNTGLLRKEEPMIYLAVLMLIGMAIMLLWGIVSTAKALLDKKDVARPAKMNYYGAFLVGAYSLVDGILAAAFLGDVPLAVVSFVTLLVCVIMVMYNLGVMVLFNRQ